MTEKQTPEKQKTLLDEAHRLIKQMIFDQKLVPGQRLVYQDLSRELNMSRTPIINALIRLQEEGFLVSEAFRGFSVKPIDVDEAWDLFGVREALEVYAVEEAIKRAEPADLEELERKYSEHAEYNPPRYTRRKFILDAAFHLQITAITKNKVLHRNLKTNLEHVYLRFPVNDNDPHRMPTAVSEHHDLVKQIRNRNISGSGMIIRTHIHEARDVVIACLGNDSESLALFDQVYEER